MKFVIIAIIFIRIGITNINIESNKMYFFLSELPYRYIFSCWYLRVHTDEWFIPGLSRLGTYINYFRYQYELQNNIIYSIIIVFSPVAVIIIVLISNRNAVVHSTRKYWLNLFCQRVAFFCDFTSILMEINSHFNKISRKESVFIYWAVIFTCTAVAKDIHRSEPLQYRYSK